MVNDINHLLQERGKQHGHFPTHADITQRLKDVIHSGRNWCDLTYAQREALEMIVHKIGRILAGDPNHIDHYDDIAGYSTLVANELREKQKCA